MVASTSKSSRYGPNERAEVDKARDVPFATFQKQATLKEARRINSGVPEVGETWADHMGINAGPVPSNLALQKTADLGLKWINISPERGWYNPSSLTAEFNRCREAGFLIHATAQEDGHDYRGLNPAAFANYCLGLFDAGANALTVINEGNNNMFFRGPDPRMQLVADLTAAVLLRVMPVHPTAKIYTTGWSPGSGALSPMMSQRALMQRLFENGVNFNHIAGVSSHPYAPQSPLWFGYPGHDDWNPVAQIGEVYKEGAVWGVRGGMALSEYGCPSEGDDGYKDYDEDWQADCMNEYYQAFNTYRLGGTPIEYMCLSTAVDGDAVTGGLEGSMGMFRENGSEKPAASVVREQGKRDW